MSERATALRIISQIYIAKESSRYAADILDQSLVFTRKPPNDA
jgi:hypothetical protein